ncbi:unnamed protein product [Echinostoma caproni]|uniref:Ribosome-associated protein n=1 Tax=Echinostoma caproni TaxID=27848 RepID=A0A183A165_9TREM|nr:unnamed protein product [Echinostoma caproni]
MQQRKLPRRFQWLTVVTYSEAEATTAQAHLAQDLQRMRSHIVTLFDGDEVEPGASIRVKAVFGLGKPRQDNSSRPPEVVLRAESVTKAILPKLNGTPVRFLRDLDPDQRSKLKTALMELRERRAKRETDLCMRDFRVHRKRPQLR